MTTTLFLKSYDKHIEIGINESEYGRTQSIRFDLDVTLTQHPTKDDITATFDYRTLISTIDTACATGRYDLLETLSQTIINTLTCEKALSHINLTITKRDILEGDATLGITQTWARTDGG